MASRILIAGGYGLVGSHIARHVREVNKEVEIVLAGRNPEKGDILAQDLGRARMVYLDLEDRKSLEQLDVGQFDLIVSALLDPADTLIHAAMEHNIAHIGISKVSDQVAPVLFAGLQSPPKQPIVLLGHWQAGVITTVVKKMAMEFSHIDAIELTALYDVHDPIGPMVVNELSSGEWTNRALLRKEGKWAWVDAQKHTRQFRRTSECILEGTPMAALDLPSLAAITKALNVRFDLVQGESIGMATRGRASHDVYIDIKGNLQSGEPAIQRTVISDPNGQAHLTALGVLVAIERVLGLDGRPPAEGGVHLPETLLSVEAAISRFEQFGVQISQVIESTE